MKNILITGAAGFIGFHLAKYYSEQEYNIWILDNLQKNENFLDKDFKKLINLNNVNFINTDLTKKIEVSSLPNEFKFIFHLAAINGTELFYKDPYLLCRNNILITINLLTFLESAKFEKLIYSSTSEVYSDADTYGLLKIPTNEDVPVVFSQPTNERYSYATSKFIGEFLCTEFCKKINVPYSTLRYHNIYGPRMGYKHVVPQLFLKILNDINPLPVIGLDETRSFCFIDDAIEATSLLAESNKTNNDLFHIGNPNGEITVNELAITMLQIANKKFEIKPLARRKSSVLRRCPDITKLSSKTNFIPKVILSEGLKKTYEYYLQNNENNAPIS